jgi:predicted DNA-binding ribbon-helix-helix protein
MMKSQVVKRSIKIDGHKTSVSLEDPFWKQLKEIAHKEEKPVAEIVAKIDKDRQCGNLSSAIRLFVLGYARDQAESGARRSGQTNKLDGPKAIEAA